MRIRKWLTLNNLLNLIIVTLAVWLAVMLLLAVMIFVTGESDEARESDVIIVLGSGLRRDGRPGDALTRRSLWGAQLYQQGIAPAVMCTGGIGDGQRRSEADACAELLRRNGVPDEAIFLEESSYSTEENAINARALMNANGWDDATLVTDSFHMLRAQWIFEIYGVEHYRSPVPRDQVRTRFYVRHFSREILALHWQAFKELFDIPITNIS